MVRRKPINFSTHTHTSSKFAIIITIMMIIIIIITRGIGIKRLARLHSNCAWLDTYEQMRGIWPHKQWDGLTSTIQHHEVSCLLGLLQIADGQISLSVVLQKANDNYRSSSSSRIKMMNLIDSKQSSVDWTTQLAKVEQTIVRVLNLSNQVRIDEAKFKYSSIKL